MSLGIALTRFKFSLKNSIIMSVCRVLLGPLIAYTIIYNFELSGLDGNVFESAREIGLEKYLDNIKKLGSTKFYNSKQSVKKTEKINITIPIDRTVRKTKFLLSLTATKISLAISETTIYPSWSLFIFTAFAVIT